ncbi:gamma-glutamylcyclotransferase [Rhizobium populisoli]|uniref:gamma-glutamylcyclotransferase n=1 Tax=Rhizobium populisoli TaxID=2859785 RepID=UPI0028B07CB0|nr:gamma-glutamylcyclotransferase [Rhizobium populisoli]
MAGSFDGPTMLDRPGEELRVRGELFDVEEDRISILDELEGIGEEWSFRTNAGRCASGRPQWKR